MLRPHAPQQYGGCLVKQAVVSAWATNRPVYKQRLASDSLQLKRLNTCCASAQDAETSRLVDDAIAAAQYEARGNYVDTKGSKYTFSQFAAWCTGEIAKNDTAATTSNSSSSSSATAHQFQKQQQQQMSHLSDQLLLYPMLEQQQRQAIVHQLLRQLMPQTQTSTPTTTTTAASAAGWSARTAVVAAGNAGPANNAGAANAGSSSSSSSSSSQVRPPHPVPRSKPVQPLPVQQQRYQQQQQQQQQADRPDVALSSGQQQQAQQHPDHTYPPPPHTQRVQQQQQQQQIAGSSNSTRYTDRPRPRSAAVAQSGNMPTAAASAASTSSSSRPPQPRLVTEGTAAATAEKLAGVTHPAVPAQAPPAAAGGTPAVTAASVVRKTLPPLSKYRKRMTLSTTAHTYQQQPAANIQLLPTWVRYFGFPPELTAAAAGSSSTSVASVAAHSVAAAQVVAPPAPAAVHSLQTDDDDSAHMSDDDPSAADAPGDSSSSSLSDSELRRQKSDASWQSFVDAAKMNENVKKKQPDPSARIKQRSKAWHRARKGRLTASTLCGMVGWYNHLPDKKGREPDQIEIWRDAVGIEKRRFTLQTRTKMKYGQKLESSALRAYQGLAPHEQITEISFKTWQPNPEMRDQSLVDDVHGWLGASPDGLITVVTPEMTGTTETLDVLDASVDDSRLAGQQESEAELWLQQQLGISPEGALEIKVPYKYGPDGTQKVKELPKPDACYMMQVQTQLEMLDREWAVMYYWSEERGSRMTFIKRDRDFFALVWQAAADFWWLHVVPAKLELQHYPKDHPERQAVIERLKCEHEPELRKDSPYYAKITALSKQMVDKAPKRVFTPEQTKNAAERMKLLLGTDEEECAAGQEGVDDAESVCDSDDEEYDLDSDSEVEEP